MKFFLSFVFMAMLLLLLNGCEAPGNSSENSSSASAIPWNKPASWEGAGALGGLGFQGTH